MKDKIVVIGGGGHAKVIINTLKKLGNFEILGYTDLIDNGLILGIRYLGTDNVLSKIIEDFPNCKAVIGISGVTISDKRRVIYSMLKELGFDLPIIISPTALVNEDTSIGEGTVILSGAYVKVDAVLGKCVIVNTGSIIEHDCKLGDFVNVTAGAIVGGGVEIGDNSMVGVGAKIIQYKKITKNCLIGAGTVVIRNINEEGTYFGVPAKKIKL